MESDKKKRNRKKKNNKQQAKTTEDGADHNHLSNGQNAQNGTVDTSTDVVDLINIHPHIDTDYASLEDNEIIQLRNEKEASLEETIKQLQSENDSHLQKEAALEETIEQLRNENDSHIQKEAALEETIEQLRNENGSHIQKGVASEEMINQLRSENDSHMQKEAGLEMKIVQLQSEKDFWRQNEASLEEKISQLLDEKAALGLKGASLEEKIEHLERDKDSWILTENTNQETIASLNVDIIRLRMQVVELEESRNNLLQENQQLMSNISGLQLQLQNLEGSITSDHLSDELTKRASEHEDLNSQIEAASILVEKLITENAELVEKVNELCVELHRQSTKGGLSSAIGTDPRVGIADPADAGPMSKSSEINLESLEVVPIKDERIGGDNVDAKPAYSSSSEAEDSAEIVQIPLDDNEIRDVELQAVESDEKADVALTDAPLIGAPFRFVSFVANYVSGADLVNKN